MTRFLLMILALLLPASLRAEPAPVIVTIKPLHALVAGVMGDTGTPELLVTGDTSPHDFQLKPSQMQALQKARILFYIDPRLETFLQNAFATLPASVEKAAVVEKAGLALLPLREGGSWEVDTHEEESAVHDHDEDMHVWLDPANAKKMVLFIAKVLGEHYPENREAYVINTNAMLARLDKLDAKITKKISGLEQKPFIVFHDAYQYLERRYHLKALGSITMDPNESPSPKRIREMQEKLRHAGASCLFREPYFSNRLVDTVLEGSSAKEGTLDPEGTDLQPGKELYFMLMENLAGNIRNCLQ